MERSEALAEQSSVDLTPSSVAEVSERLLLWGKRDGAGLARVEYSSEFDRQKVVQLVKTELEQAGIAWTEIELPTRRPAEEIVQFLREQLAEVSEGVVSVTGFATAFEAGTPLADALRVVNFNREALVALPLRQLWWMTPQLLQASLYAMPDLHGWFRPQLRLNPVLSEEVVADSGAINRLGAGELRSVNFEDARQRSQNLVVEFEAARRAGAADQDLLTTYLLPALESLAEVGAQQELQDLTSRFEFFLGSLKLGKTLDMATALDRLAGLYFAQGRYREAEPMFLTALEVRKAELGDCHPDTATSLNNLALLYDSQGHYGEAEPLHVEALEIRQTELGERHPETARSLNNLAALYESQGRYGEAEALYVKALDIHKIELGERHLATATSLNNLAALYESQGRYVEAEPLYVEALDIHKTELGERHPDTATSLNNLAGLYKSQGRYGEAEALYVEALEIKKAELGERHPDTATSLNNLALLYKSQGRYEEAEALYVEALETRKTELGEHHASTANSLLNLAALYYQTERYSQALNAIEQALQIYIPALGADHPTTQAATSWLQPIQHKLQG